MEGERRDGLSVPLMTRCNSLQYTQEANFAESDNKSTMSNDILPKKSAFYITNGLNLPMKSTSLSPLSSAPPCKTISQFTCLALLALQLVYLISLFSLQLTHTAVSVHQLKNK